MIRPAHLRARPSTLWLIAGLVAATGAVLTAGPLDPPLGPVASTYKTLNEVEPRTAINLTNTPGDADSVYKIVQPGSYYLTGNILGAASKHGIEIVANGVTIDLCGFELLGVVQSLDGVSATVANLTNIAVLNGSVRSWGQDGVDLSTSLARNFRIASVLASENGSHGIKGGYEGSVLTCSSRSNGSTGIWTGAGSVVLDCRSSGNEGTGIFAHEACVISRCASYNNDIDGIQMYGGSVSHCSAAWNTSVGIRVTDPSSEASGAVTACQAWSNAGGGIWVGNGSHVSGCTAKYNGNFGISCRHACIVRDNTCAQNANGSPNLLVTHSDNRIEGNVCTLSTYGIKVDGDENLILKNSCSSNTTNYSIVVGNIIAPIIPTPVSAVVISGSSYGGSLGSSDANANYAW